MREWTEDDAVDLRARPIDVSEERLADARHEVDEALKESDLPPDFDDGLPLTDEAIHERTSEHRIDLADNVPDVSLVPSYGGYLDVVMHGDAAGTQAAVNGQHVDFTLRETGRLIQESPHWDHRPIRLMSCSTGQGRYAQDLANDLGVPVYAPDDVLSVEGGVNTVLHDGRWRRFEPSEEAYRTKGTKK